jgi:thioredoxin 1
VIPSYDGKVQTGQGRGGRGRQHEDRRPYGARGFPTVLLFKNGEEVARFHSAKPEHFVREFIDEHLD